jgi:DNA-binding NarL/FixJ family response regulator
MQTNHKYNILIVDDHPIVRDGIMRLIEVNGEMRVCGETGDGNEVMNLISKSKPDAVVLDLTLEGADGLSLISQINARYPKIPILILSMHNELTYAKRSIQAGARGYLMKKSASREIIVALHKILKNGIYVSDAVKEQILSSFSKSNCNAVHSINTLSPREFQVFRLYGEGLRTAQIADKLQCSPKTIETHCYRIRRKLNQRSLSELIAQAGAYFGAQPTP